MYFYIHHFWKLQYWIMKILKIEKMCGSYSKCWNWRRILKLSSNFFQLKIKSKQRFKIWQKFQYSTQISTLRIWHDPRISGADLKEILVRGMGMALLRPYYTVKRTREILISNIHLLSLQKWSQFVHFNIEKVFPRGQP